MDWGLASTSFCAEFRHGSFWCQHFSENLRKTAEKLQTYECGEVVEGSAWLQFNVRFYVIALIFLIFDVEVVFLFPWAVVFKDMGMVALVEMGIFLSILIVGLAYVWVKSDLDWIKRTVRYGSGRYQKIAMEQDK